MDSRTYADIRSKLKSDKIKDRVQGIRDLDQSQNWRISDPDYRLSTGKWKALFEDIFGVIRTESNAALKGVKSVDTSKERLGSACKCLRSVIDRSADCWNGKVLAHLLEHLTNFFVNPRNESLLPIIDNDYLYSLKRLTGHRVHHRHIPEECWTQIVELCFNYILGQPMNKSISKSAHVPPENDDEDESEEELPTLTKKRRKVASSQRPTPQPEKPPDSGRQGHCAEILSQLLQSPYSYVCSTKPLKKGGHHKYLYTAVLERLQCIIERSTSEALHVSYLTSVVSSLKSLALNHVAEVRSFARKTWPLFVQFWGARNTKITLDVKEQLVIVLRTLFPYIIPEPHLLDDLGEIARVFDDMMQLSSAVPTDARNMQALSLDSLRLELRSSKDDDGPFVANTFRADWTFSPGHALTWAILELQANCIRETLRRLDDGHTATPDVRRRGKRAKFQNPITSTLDSISRAHTPQIRCFHLQVLLFVVDQHWQDATASVKHEIISALFDLPESDADVQSWVFINFAAMAFAERRWATSHLNTRASSQIPEVVDQWQKIWDYAIRRTVMPQVCRAACHAAHSLLVSLYGFNPPSGHTFLSTPTVLKDIENLGKELDVQGLQSPSDSVCMFLVQCFKIVAQDAHTFRAALEQSVFDWLTGTWQVSNVGRAPLIPHSVNDVLLLLETISGVESHSDLVVCFTPPSCPITDSMREERQQRVIRDFMLFADLPSYTTPQPSPTKQFNTRHNTSSAHSDLLSARGRAGKMSRHLQKMVEGLLAEWEGKQKYEVEEARRALDFAIIVAAYEATHFNNSIAPNKKTMQAAGKLLVLVYRAFKSTVSLVSGFSSWDLAESVALITGFEPLVRTSKTPQDDPWTAMILPDHSHDGIVRHGHDLLPLSEGTANHLRSTTLSTLWKDYDLHRHLEEICRMVRADILEESKSLHEPEEQGDRGFKQDDFKEDEAATALKIKQRPLNARKLDIQLMLIIRGPLLHSFSGDLTRDRQLVKVVADTRWENVDWFFLAGPILFREVVVGALEFNADQLCGFLELFDNVERDYNCIRDPEVITLQIQAVAQTINLWTTPAGATAMAQVAETCEYICESIRDFAWPARDEFLRFTLKYLTMDPSQSAWPARAKLEDSLLKFLKDPDVRVRFRTAVTVPKLFTAPLPGGDGTELFERYTRVKDSLSTQADLYEHMMTRFLSLANIMVVSSSVRRGPYWHLLEICHHTTVYEEHIRAVLQAVVDRLGMPSLSSLFRAYSTQIAWSMLNVNKDILDYPERAFGYETRSAFLNAAFPLFIPTYVVLDAFPQYQVHCKAIRKNPNDGFREHFGNIAGFYAACWFDTQRGGSNNEDQLEADLREVLKMGDEFTTTLEMHVDSVISAILRTLSDQDCSDKGPIAQALAPFEKGNKNITQVFHLLTRYRHLQSFIPHVVNSPAFSARSVLSAFSWVSRRVPNALHKAAVYHVVHDLLANIQDTPLINEKFRLLNALCMWISLRHEDFKDATLLHTLLHGTCSLLAQPSLARAAQSILEWTLRNYRKLKTADARLSRILIRISSTCQGYETSSNETLRTLGTDLIAWLDEQTALLGEVPILLPKVQKALPAWAHTPSDKLSKIQESVSLGDLTSIIRDEHVSFSKFRIVKRLKEPRFQKNLRFATDAFWRLKESIPPSEFLQKEEITSFVELLLSQHGRIDGLNVQQTGVKTIRHQHQAMHKRSPSSTPEELLAALPKDAIIQGLLNLLEDNDPTLVHSAYNTLRIMLSTDTVDGPRLANVPSEGRAEIELLQVYPRPGTKREERHLSELLEETKAEDRLDLSTNFTEWIRHITCLISNVLGRSDEAYGQLRSILESDASTAAEMFPVLVYALLETEQRLDLTGSSYKMVLSQYFTNILNYPNASIQCLESIVDAVLHVRSFSPRGKEGALSYNHRLDIDFNLLSKSAVRCGAYTTAVMFLELAHDVGPNGNLDSQVAERIQYEIYAHIDEPDGFYGIQTGDLQRFLVQRIQHEEQWDKAFRFYGAALETGSRDGFTESSDGLVRSFHAFGFNRLANASLQESTDRVSPSERRTSAVEYRLGWRTEGWDLPDSDTYTVGAPLYHALRATHRRQDSTTIRNHIDTALCREMDHLRSLGTESVTQIREVLQALMALGQLAQWYSPNLQQDLKSRTIDHAKWRDFVDISDKFGFSDLENIISVRMSLLRSNRQQEAPSNEIGTIASSFLKDLYSLEKQCLLTLSQAARKDGQIQIALNSVLRARTLETQPSFEVSREYANVLWSLKEEKIAVQYLKGLLDSGPVSSLNNASRASLNATLGTWISEACLQKPLEIWRNHFEPAMRDVMDLPAPQQASIASVYQKCAVFADKQYHQLVKSPDAIRLKVYIDRKNEEIKRRVEELDGLKGSQAHQQRYREVSRAQDNAQKLLNTDNQRYAAHELARNNFLQQALTMYSRCLEVTDEFDNEASIKFCSLWFANFDDEKSLGDVVHKSLGKIPSRKFVFLAHQLTARISSTSNPSKNQSDLQRLILRLCREHPFHSVYQVYCLQADSVQLTAAPSGSRQSARRSLASQASSQIDLSESQTERCRAAENVLNILRQDRAVGERVRDISTVCDAYLQWAKFPIANKPEFKGVKSPKIPPEMRIARLGKCKVPVLTAQTKIDPTLKYENCVWIEKYESAFTTAGGINLPKISMCIGSDGRKYKQLFKGEGKDDMRQDAVMEQVFELVNTILAQDRDTSRRALHIRSYKVVPLGTQAGVLEFVGNTSPLREWLSGGHGRYRPNDLSVKDANTKLARAKNEGAATRVRVFNEVCARFQPVFRHFFTERLRNPVTWFSTRLRYVRSVAASSIVGHVLGLGDRHTSNILMDNVTGEVVHIDLGIAFDQGKLLPTPELVPFRLTRDMVDGMGIAGTQGVFQRCAEETLRVLRDGSDIMMTVLEVFKHDPLHSWTASEIKIQRVQGDRNAAGATGAAPSAAAGTTTAAAAALPLGDSTAANLATVAHGHGLLLGIGIDMTSGTAQESADRALSSVARKLDKALNVQSTVNELIAEATDPANLGQIYFGWAPHM